MPMDDKKLKEGAYHSIVHSDIFFDVFLSGSMPELQNWLVTESLTKQKFQYLFILSVDVLLRGISQVFLCNHPITGIFICVGLAFSSFRLLGYAFLATAVSTASALLIAKPAQSDVLAGLCGYDGALVGCACCVCLDQSYSAVAALFLSSLAGVLHSATANLLGAWHLPPFTLAFNLVMMGFLVASASGAITLEQAAAAAPSLARNDHWTHEVTLISIFDISLRGVGQFMFIDTRIGAAFVVAGVAVASRTGAFVAVCGAMVGFIMAYYVLHVPRSELYNVRIGMYGYNCAGTMAALSGGVFYKISENAFIVGIYGAMLCSLVTVGLNGMFQGLPLLTFPFIISTWLMMLTHTTLLTEPSATGVDGSGGIMRPLLEHFMNAGRKRGCFKTSEKDTGGDEGSSSRSFRRDRPRSRRFVYSTLKSPRFSIGSAASGGGGVRGPGIGATASARAAEGNTGGGGYSGVDCADYASGTYADIESNNFMNNNSNNNNSHHHRDSDAITVEKTVELTILKPTELLLDSAHSGVVGDKSSQAPVTPSTVVSSVPDGHHHSLASSSTDSSHHNQPLQYQQHPQLVVDCVLREMDDDGEAKVDSAESGGGSGDRVSNNNNHGTNNNVYSSSSSNNTTGSDGDTGNDNGSTVRPLPPLPSSVLAMVHSNSNKRVIVPSIPANFKNNKVVVTGTI